jgi:hypothetical protein
VARLPPPTHAAKLLTQCEEETHDWRNIETDDFLYWLERYKGETRAENEPGMRELMSIAALGTIQACIHGGFAAPDGSMVNCGHAGYPLSLGYREGNAGRPLRDPGPLAEMLVFDGVHPLDAACVVQHGIGRNVFRQVAVVHAVATGEMRGLLPSFANYREAQLFVRTPYLQAIEVMPRHLHEDPLDLLADGGVIYTPGVHILRGPVEEGLPWLEPDTAVDVICVAIPRQPSRTDDGQYAHPEEKARVEAALELVIKVAMARGVDTLVIPPIGLEHMCLHPSEAIADLVHSVVSPYRHYFDKIILAWYGRPRDGSYTDAFKQGRRPLPPPPKMTVTAAQVYSRNRALKPVGVLHQQARGVKPKPLHDKRVHGVYNVITANEPSRAAS